MGRIHILPDSIVNKIAAGEVVERPASVVKELVENSLDAGAKSITVTLKVGGKNHIKVVDDGCGMTTDDALTALERHATSKISHEKDLEHILTMGFRGEALPSIAAVSRMNIISRCPEQAAGVHIYMEGGRIIKVKEIGVPVGTSIEVDNLFFNVPARRKFLKTTATELSHITRVLTYVALARPKLRLRTEHNGRKIFHVPAAANLPERIAQVLGTHVRSEMLPLDFSANPHHIKGLILKPTYARTGKSEQIVFVNKRPVRNSIISRAAYDAYSAMLEHNRHPGWILFLKIDPREVDVNVHPAKSEVRFANQKQIYELVRAGITDAFNNADLSPKSRHFIPQSAPAASTAVEPEKKYPPVSGKRSGTIQKMVTDYIRSQKKPETEDISFADGPTPVSAPKTHDSSQPRPEAEKPSFEAEKERDRREENKSIAEWVPIGQFHDSFLICQCGDELILIDQHAAHERILFEKFLRDLAKRSLEVQRLLIPIPLELAPAEAIVMDDYLDCFSQLGFSIDHFGRNTFMVKEIPAILGQEDIRLLIKDVLAELSQTGQSIPLSVIKEKIAASTACRAAVKANQKLQTEEIRSLLEQMGKTANPYCCPHGRPCVVKYPLARLRKDFHRT